MNKWFTSLFLVFALLLTLGFTLAVGCGDDDDDDDVDDDDDADTDDDDDDDNDDNDTSDDDDDDDDDDDAITDFVLAFTNAKMKLDGTIEADQSFISVGGTIEIEQIGKTTGAPIVASLKNAEFLQCEINWSTGAVSIFQDGDTGTITLSEINSTIIAAKGGLTPTLVTGAHKAGGSKGEVFNIASFTPCASGCEMAIYIGAYDVFSVNQFTDAPIGVFNDYMLMWQFMGTNESGDTIDLTVNLEQ